MELGLRVPPEASPVGVSQFTLPSSTGLVGRKEQEPTLHQYLHPRIPFSPSQQVHSKAALVVCASGMKCLLTTNKGAQMLS